MELKFKYHKQTRYLIIGMFGIILMCSSILIYALNPLEWFKQKMLYLTPGSILFKLWTAPPYVVHIKAFIFNVTNPNEFLSGREKLKLVEIGPYAYREILTNNNPQFNDNGSLTYYPKRELVFDLDQSIGDPQVDHVNSLNIPLLGITATVTEMPMFFSLGISSISSYLGSEPFKNLSIHDYLWGYNDELVTLANNVIPSWIDFPTFGILDRIMALDNGNNTVTILVDPSKEYSKNELLTEDMRKTLYNIQTFNGSPGLKQWGYRDVEVNETAEENCKCNTLEGSLEGGIFPPHLQKNSSFRMYRRAFCRPVEFEYEDEIVSKSGFNGYTYRLADNFLATPEENPDNSCYCHNDVCPKKGLGWLTPCYYKIPIAISQPHFYNGDPSLHYNIEGLNPDNEKHDSMAIVQPDFGMPLEARLRIQINLVMPKTKFNPKTKPFNDMTLPLFWLELSVEDIPFVVKFCMTMFLYVLPIVFPVLMWLCGIFGISMLSLSALFIFYMPDRPIEFEDPYGSIDYSPIRIMKIPQYFKSDIRIS